MHLRPPGDHTMAPLLGQWTPIENPCTKQWGTSFVFFWLANTQTSDWLTILHFVEVQNFLLKILLFVLTSIDMIPTDESVTKSF